MLIVPLQAYLHPRMGTPDVAICALESTAACLSTPCSKETQFGKEMPRVELARRGSELEVAIYGGQALQRR